MTKTISIYLDDEALTLLDRAAEAHDNNKSATIAALLAEKYAPEKLKENSDDDDGINVFVEHGEIIARVKYNDNLDYWDGRNSTCGETGKHKGLTRLMDGQYVLIRGTQWQGERDSAYIISADEAYQEIIKSGNTELLKEGKFEDLRQFETKLIKERL